jgi:zinc/manganese transport system ATP-binding protein
VLSQLYRSEIDVVRLKDRIFIMSGSHDMEHDAHQHDDARAHQYTPR